jgi:DNA-binding transcriptional ArsR family regulator
VDEVFRALADPSRRRLLDRLNDRTGQTLHELCAGQGLTRQSVSKHLAILEAANLVTTVRRGREKLHYLNAAPISDIVGRWIGRYDAAGRARAAGPEAGMECETCRREGTGMSALAPGQQRFTAPTPPTDAGSRPSWSATHSTRPSTPGSPPPPRRRSAESLVPGNWPAGFGGEVTRQRTCPARISPRGLPG